MRVEGLFLPLTTPFYPDGRLYLRKLEHNVDRYSRTPAAGLALLTPTGEASLLSDSERIEVLRIGADIAAKEKVLLADCSRPGVGATLDLIATADALGYDAALLRLPLELANSTAAENALRRVWFQTIVDRSPLPLILAEHRDPATWLAPDFIAGLSRTGQVLGWICGGSPADRISTVRELTAAVSRILTVTPVFAAATRRMLTVAEPAAAGGNYIAAASLTAGATALATEPPVAAVRTRTKRVGFQILAGESTNLLTALLPFAVCAPQATYEVHAAWKDADEPLAAEKATRVQVAARVVEEELGTAGLKVGCDRNGYFGGRPRLPLVPLRGDQEREIETLLRGMRS